MKTIEPLDSKMLIVIATYKREDKQKVYYSIPKELLPITYFATVESRAEILRSNFPESNILVLPDDTDGIAQTRQRCFDMLPKGKILMLDDLIKIYGKRFFDEEKQCLRAIGHITNEEFMELYSLISSLLDEYAQVGIIPRMRTQQLPNKLHENQRIYAVNALRTDVLESIGVRIDGMYQKNKIASLLEDFYITLCLLTKGYKNAVICDYVFDRAHNLKGGNSGIRTQEVQKICAKQLESEFPDFVIAYKKVKEKLGWKDMAGRWDVRVKWKAAFEYGDAITSNSANILDFM